MSKREVTTSSKGSMKKGTNVCWDLLSNFGGTNDSKMWNLRRRDNRLNCSVITRQHTSFNQIQLMLLIH